MVVGIELGKEYVQLCVKTDAMKEPESLSKIAGEEHYRMPTEADLGNQEELSELFRGLWKLLLPYGNKNTLEHLVYCLEENTADLREKLGSLAKIYNIPPEKLSFLGKEECFASYVIHQSGELLAHNALLIENHQGEKSKYLLHRHSKTVPALLEVKPVGDTSLEGIFTDHSISSVFLVGDDYEEAWMEQNLKVLKTGKRIFMGKNLFVKGACYFAWDLKEQKEMFCYLGQDKVKYHVMLRTGQEGPERYTAVVPGGRNWYDSHEETDVILMEDGSLEFALVPVNGREKKTVVVELKELPVRPPKTTRLHLRVEFTDAAHARLTITDLGFGELFPKSDMVYEGELSWEQ